MIDVVAAIWTSLPPAPWPSRWRVEQLPLTPDMFAVALSRSPRRDVRLGVDASLVTMILDDPPREGACVEVIGVVRVSREYGGLMGACERAAELALAHLVMET